MVADNDFHGFRIIKDYVCDSKLLAIFKGFPTHCVTITHQLLYVLPSSCRLPMLITEIICLSAHCYD